MALHIILKNDLGQLREIQWSVGTPAPFVSINFYNIYKVGEVRASGAELDYINVMFRNLPQVTPKGVDFVRWFGDDARFIAGNL